jgi:putative hydrolases of HD superfamily
VQEDERMAGERPAAASEAVVAFWYELGLLKRARRTGWWFAGVDDPESIAEHSFRAALIAALLAALEGADAARAALLALLHDTQETRVGDIPLVGKAYVRALPNEQVTQDQTAGLPEGPRELLRGLVAEYEGRTSREAELARDADKLECLLQAREYAAQGYTDVPAWIETSVAALRTDSAKELAGLAQDLPPSTWWREAAARRPPPP